MSIFRAYDIRGIYGKDISDVIMEKIGKALGTHMLRNNKGNEVLVGHDVRRSSPSLSKAFIKGVASTGVNITDAGASSFGLALFSGWKLRKDATAYITASHNPPEWNGIKLFDSEMVGYFEKTLKKLEKLVNAEDFEEGTGRTEKANLKKEYVDYLSSRLKAASKIKIVVDTGNGATSSIAPELFRKAGYEAIGLHTEANPDFPGRGPNIRESDLSRLRKTVPKEGADFGVAFDGDGDRVAFVDDKGNFIKTEEIAVVLARNLVKKEGETLITNVETSLLFRKALEPMGAEIKVIPVGHTYMGQETKKHSAILGIEPSAHMTLPLYAPFDDAFIPALKIAEIISLEGKPLSRLLSGMPRYFREQNTFACPDEKKFEAIEDFKRHFAGKHERINTLDGIRIDFDNSWILIRASNTSPKIRLTVEAETKERLDELINEFSDFLNNELAKY